jgi:hypothetical protein
MSAQRLSDKSARRIGRETGLDIVRAWSHGGYIFDFVIADDNPTRHLHGWYDKKTGQWALDAPEMRSHYDTCYTELFPPPTPHAHMDEH